MKRINKFKSVDKYKRQAFIKRIDELNLPLDKLIMNHEKLLEDHTILIPNIDTENKTREVDFLVNHIESLINELDFFLREERKKNYINMTKEISQNLDEDMIDIDELYDRVLFGNSFDSTVEELIFNKNLNENKSFNSKSKTKESLDNTKNKKTENLVFKKSDKLLKEEYLKNIKNKNCFKILKNGSKENKMEKVLNEDKFNKLKFKNKNTDYDNTYYKRNVMNLIGKKSKYLKNSGLVKRIYVSSKLGIKRVNSLILRKNKIKVRHRNENLDSDTLNEDQIYINCYKCYNKTNNDNSNFCNSCKSVYHTYCVNLKTNDLNGINDKICNYCINSIVTKESCKKNGTNINILNDSVFEYNFDYDSDIKTQNFSKEDMTSQNINYKCQRLEYGLRKFSNDYSIDNSLFLECINKLLYKENN